MGDKNRGVYEKFIVRRTDRRDSIGEKHFGCEYFVLDLRHDPLAIPAIRAYAEAAHTNGYNRLANDLENWLATQLPAPPAPEADGKEKDR